MDNWFKTEYIKTFYIMHEIAFRPAEINRFFFSSKWLMVGQLMIVSLIFWCIHIGRLIQRLFSRVSCTLPSNHFQQVNLSFTSINVTQSVIIDGVFMPWLYAFWEHTTYLIVSKYHASSRYKILLIFFF